MVLVIEIKLPAEEETKAIIDQEGVSAKRIRQTFPNKKRLKPFGNDVSNYGGGSIFSATMWVSGYWVDL